MLSAQQALRRYFSENIRNASFDLGAGDNTFTANLATAGGLTVGGNLSVRARDGFDTVTVQGAGAVNGGVNLALGDGGSSVSLQAGWPSTGRPGSRCPPGRGTTPSP